MKFHQTVAPTSLVSGSPGSVVVPSFVKVNVVGTLIWILLTKSSLLGPLVSRHPREFRCEEIELMD